jgi:DNA-binding MarR family transcriptional regulator
MAKIAEVYISTVSEMMSPLGLDRNFVALIYLCENSGVVTQKDLGQRLNKDKVSTMRVVDYLCERDLIERVQDDSDRRCHLLAAKKKGLELYPKVKAAIERTNEIILEDLSTSDLEQFSRTMELINNKIKSLPDSDFIIEANKRSENK